MVIGLTGNIFSGKSSVAKLFKAKGASIIDADKISHSMLKKNRSKVNALFGKYLIKRRIAEIVFKDKRKLNQLCGLLHPQIIAEIKKKIEKAKSKRPNGTIIIDAPLLIESGLYKKMDKNILVTCPRNLIIKRAQKEGMGRKEVLLRLKRQMSEENKKKHADFTIKNKKGIRELRKQVEEVIKKLR